MKSINEQIRTVKRDKRSNTGRLVRRLVLMMVPGLLVLTFKHQITVTIVSIVVNLGQLH